MYRTMIVATTAAAVAIAAAFGAYEIAGVMLTGGMVNYWLVGLSWPVRVHNLA